MTEAVKVSCSVPIRRSRWVSFWIGLAAGIVSLLLAAALAGLLLLLPVNVNGVVVILAFGVLLFGLFFLSLPWQRRYAHTLDLRQPGISLTAGLLTIPVSDVLTLHFKLDEPHELIFGWFEVITKSTGGPTTHTRSFMTYTILSQGGQKLLLKAEDSVREAQGAGWPNSTSSVTPDLSVRLWASDLVLLVEAVRARVRPAAPEFQTPAPAPVRDSHTPEEAVREWPDNPLQARNRHEAMLFSEWLKVELISHTPIEGGEVWVGRTPESAAAVPPYLYRFVFALLEADPEDENDFGSGVSKIFDPMELMLQVSRLESDNQLNTGANDMRNDAVYVLSHQTTREIAANRRANARGIALLEQLMRFAQADGYPAEESLRTSASRTYYRRTQERFHISALKSRQQALRENLKFLQLPVTNLASARQQAMLVQELRERCPDYLAELQRAGFEGEQIQHPNFSHGFHLTRYAARSLQQGKVEQARAAFTAWTIAEPNELLFPTREFAEATFELKLELIVAMPFVPSADQHYFATCYGNLVDPDYNPWLY
ncbi:MAG: hypothetical protein QOJ02_1849 [Acidobacteriota bacterium]|nr:hypothetical protein [Acidobacteriota bacterium]